MIQLAGGKTLLRCLASFMDDPLLKTSYPCHLISDVIPEEKQFECSHLQTFSGSPKFS